ncbi:hypothetical protein [Maritalea porphyrae]|uniref:Uncharacterized protein n=1 Tax=Maritalea porphyrae TaxID=880732 RepID=A0ABQ5UL53_9HYPH|nr:hypothetical protein [Maritalea porphyrae]GLQ15781.1 hypothetical protein GCM10007879_00300 [Maritalea porphyrae]
MSALSGAGRGDSYARTDPIEKNLRVEVAKAKLQAVEAANEATLTAINEVVRELNLPTPEGMGLLVDKAV